MQTTPLFRSLSTSVFGRGFLRSGAVLLLAATALLVGGCNTSTDDENLALFASNAPLPSIVPAGTELSAAQKAALRQPGCFALAGEGASMEPVYMSGTAMVVRPGGFENLRKGTPVIYVNTKGVTVAHMLIEETPFGWVAQGLNNDRPDPDKVTESNLVGVITQAYASRTGVLPAAIAGRVAMTREVNRGATVASLGN
jgi:hypothetical protein